jgi:hypothetical protein
MADTADTAQPKIIVIPKPLEAFFYERLKERYAEQPDVRVIVDRRSADRRRGERYVCGPGPLTDRRAGDRRNPVGVWSLVEMPFSAS